MDHLFESKTDPVPFGHGEFRVVHRADLAIAKDVADLVDVSDACGEQSLHAIFRGGVKVADLIAFERNFHDVDVQIDRRCLGESWAVDFDHVALMKK